MSALVFHPLQQELVATAAPKPTSTPAPQKSAAEPARMQLTNADVTGILWPIARHKALGVEQLCWINGRSAQANRHRLRKLKPAGYVHPLPLSVTHGVTTGCTYVLTPLGLDTVRYFCDLPPGAIPFSRAVPSWKPRFIHHHKLTTDTWIHAERSARSAGLELRFIPEYELRDPKATRRTEKFLLKFGYEGPRPGVKLTHEPDGAFIVRALGAPKSEAVCLYLESDRGGLSGQPVVTQNLQRSSVRGKLLAARSHYLAGDHKAFAPTMAIVFVVEGSTTARCEHIAKALAEVPEISDRVFITRSALVRSEDFFRSEIWTRADGSKSFLFNPAASAEAEKEEDDSHGKEAPHRVGPQPARCDARTAVSA